MKYLKALIIIVVIISIQSCDNIGNSGSDIVKNKKEYLELKDAVEKCKQDFNNKTIDQSKYSKMMEDFGDVYVESVDAIPPERRYTMAIYCYKSALKYDKTNKDLKKKLQEQQSLYQVVNQ